MDISLKNLEDYFHVKKEEGALLFVFLTLLAPGGTINFLNGCIEKITEDTFRLKIDEDIYRTIANDFSVSREEQNEYDIIFAPKNDTEEEEEE